MRKYLQKFVGPQIHYPQLQILKRYVFIKDIFSLYRPLIVYISQNYPERLNTTFFSWFLLFRPQISSLVVHSQYLSVYCPFPHAFSATGYPDPEGCE